MDEKMQHLRDEISDLEKELEAYKNKCKDQEVIIANENLLLACVASFPLNCFRLEQLRLVPVLPPPHLHLAFLWT